MRVIFAMRPNFWAAWSFSVRQVAVFYALLAVVLWSLFATLALTLKALPPFLLLGLALSIGGSCGLLKWRDWRIPVKTLIAGTGGIFGYHLCIFLAFRHAPAVEANLINYLWPLFIVLLVPLFQVNSRLGRHHVAGACLGFIGCMVATGIFQGITQGSVASEAGTGLHYQGDFYAFLAAVIWALYTLINKRLPPFGTGAVGAFCLLSGLMSLVIHGFLEPAYRPSLMEWAYVILLGLGPMGLAFFAWDLAFKLGDARVLGGLAYLTPVMSTIVLTLAAHQALALRYIVALLLIVTGALIGNGAWRMLAQRQRAEPQD